MLDEMPVVKPSKSPKILAASPLILEAMPFLNSQISFKPFVDYLKDMRASVSETKERLYSYLIKKFESEPSLLQPISDIGVIDENSDLM